MLALMQEQPTEMRFRGTRQVRDPQELCIICREALFADGGPAKALPCGHGFHLTCLKDWILVQQHCPTCRAFQELIANPISELTIAESTVYATFEDAVAISLLTCSDWRSFP